MAVTTDIIHPVNNPDGIVPSCAGLPTSIYFPSHGTRQGANYELTKRVCDACELKAMCLEWAVHKEDSGIWAGTGPEERAAIRRERGITLAAPEARTA